MVADKLVILEFDDVDDVFDDVAESLDLLLLLLLCRRFDDDVEDDVQLLLRPLADDLSFGKFATTPPPKPSPYCCLNRLR